ncbi:MAG: WD40 repeat domain-containing protein [Planctomycetota bacterium]
MNDERLQSLIEGLLDERLSASDQDELAARLRSSAEARRHYLELVEQDALLHDVVRESAGRDLALMAANDLSVGQPLGQSPVGQSSAPAAAIPTSKAALPLGIWLTAGGVLLALGFFLVGTFFQKPKLPPESATTGEPTATLNSLVGEVWRTDARRKSVQAASAQAFYAGDRLHVGEASAAEVTLVDGTRVVLSADSVLHFQRFDAFDRTLRLARGSAEVEAAPQSPNRPLVIITEQARLTVLGTRFRLYTSASDSRVELEEGTVQFERQSDGQTVEVAAGQYAVANAESAKPLDAETLSYDWRLRQTLHRAGDRVAFSHDGAKLATAAVDRVKLWNVATGEFHQMVDNVARFDCLAFAQSNETLVALSESGKVLHWPLGLASPQTRELTIANGNLRRCAVSHDGRWLAQTSDIAAGYLPIWRVGDAGEISLVRSIPMKMSSVAIAATSQSPQVVASNLNGTTVIWDAETGSELARYRFRSQLHVLALSDDGRQMCGYGNATGLLILDTESGEQRTFWPSDSARVNGLRFSRDGRELVAGMADGLVRGWSTATGEPTFVLPTGDARVLSLAVADDGRSLATVGDKGSVKLWQRDE